MIEQWNATREGSPMSGVRRYEEEMGSIDGVDRVQRQGGKCRGSTPVSWLLDYRVQGRGATVHATYETVSPAVLANLHRRPDRFVVTCHGLIPLRYPSLILDPITRLLWNMVPRAMRTADEIIAVSEFTRGEIVELLRIPEERITVIHHGVDHDRFCPQDVDPSKFGLDPDDVHVLVVSPDKPQKRPDITEAVARELPPGYKVVTTSYGGDLDGVDSVGWIDEDHLPLLYNMADVLFHPSEYESFGLPILESMACGTPVVASMSGSIPEVTGWKAFLVDVRDRPMNAIVDKFVDGITDRARESTDYSAVGWSYRYSWEQCRRETEEVYRR